MDEIVTTFRNASHPLAERIMTTADQLRQEGKQEAELRAIRAFLGMKMSVPTIAAALELTETEMRQRIEVLHTQTGDETR